MDVAALTLAKAELWRAWQIVSGAYSAFEVNVTTDAAVYEAAEARNRGKACISNEDGRSTCAVNAFGTSRCCNVYNKGSGAYQGLTTSHELGHLMGLQHDGGGSGGEYFEGLSAFRWVPVMGNMTPKSSWARRRCFSGARASTPAPPKREDDLAIITRNLPYREDDIPDAKALVVANGGQVSSVDNRGQIARNTDSDTFTFAIGSGGGRATLVVDRIEYFAGGYLDVDAEIQDASGMTIAQSNDKVARTAKLDVSLPAGEYRLIIKGGAEGTPQNGFSNYSSLGYYGISGSITGGGVGGGGAGGGGGGGGGAGGTGGGSAGNGSGGRGGSRAARAAAERGREEARPARREARAAAVAAAWVSVDRAAPQVGDEEVRRRAAARRERRGAEVRAAWPASTAVVEEAAAPEALASRSMPGRVVDRPAPAAARREPAAPACRPSPSTHPPGQKRA